MILSNSHFVLLVIDVADGLVCYPLVAIGYQLSFTLLNPDPARVTATWNIQDVTKGNYIPTHIQDDVMNMSVCGVMGCSTLPQTFFFLFLSTVVYLLLGTSQSAHRYCVFNVL